MKKKILVTSRTFGQVDVSPVRILEENGFEIIRHEQQGLLREDKFCELIADCDALIIGADQLTSRVMDAAKRLRLVCKHGTGIDNIDLASARSHGIKVTNVPALNADAVADTAMALILDVSRKISYAAGRVKAGYWEKHVGRDVCFKKLGIVGLGSVGQKLACRAHGFGMQIFAYDAFLGNPPDALNFVCMREFDELLRVCDILTLHVPLSDSTRNLIAGPQMEHMKKGAILINTSRGGILDEDALYHYLRNGHLGGAGMDVTKTEPPFGSPLLTLDNVTILPHMASYSEEALSAVSMVCVRNILHLFTGKPLQYTVVD